MALGGTVVLGPDRAGRVVAVADGRVVPAGDVGPDAPRIPCEDGEIGPGLVNAHTHLYSGLAPLGMPAPSPRPEVFVQILERVWWRLDRALGPETLRAGARLYAAESLLRGVTTLVDHHESPDFIEGSLGVLAEAVDGLGARALLAYGATERNGGRAEAQRGLAECARLAREHRSRRVLALVGLHAGFTASDDTVREAGALCRELGTVLHVHMAEDLADVEDARRRGFDGPLERLAALDALPPGSILAHGVHLAPAQVRRAGHAGAWLVQNPRSNEGNGVGYAASLGASEQVALGTDGWPSDMEAEVAAVARLGAEAGDSELAGRARLAAGHRLVSQRFACEPEALLPGALGDLVVRAGGEVRHVVVDGHVVVRDGALVTADAGAIRAEAATAAPALWERMKGL